MSIKTTGCTTGKTFKEIDEFFESLLSFYYTDIMFFDEQVTDLQEHEKVMFAKFLIRKIK